MVTPVYPVTPPVPDITRPRLRQIAYWIRDELDPIIASEGPEHLRADDVLVLHDMFQALRMSTIITTLDLRATGIHKAVIDVSGIATRWPGRLCDDCDKIISIWIAKFGRLEDLHPFLYGRGGRLEGIASVEDSSKEALINRWQKTCPKRISPKKSHRHGDLGFRAGEWWINPLFACHAGILDIDSVEGGICYDKHGAYAMLLKDTGEIDAPAESNFKYRCGRNDKGRFRLTAATPKSRTPVRVLRSHSINSIWGPKAGVRYEGLYNVVGWSVHEMKSAAISDDEYRAGDIVYDLHLVRDDPVPMEEVVKTPTTFQVDEYTEYKRLRKVYREMQRKGENGKMEVQTVPVKVAPPIPPSAPAIPLPRSMSKMSPSASRTATMKRIVATSAEPLSPCSRQSSRQGAFEEEELLRGPPVSMLRVPTQTTSRSLTLGSRSESPVSDSKSHPPHPATMPALQSTASSTHSHTSDIREVAPWIDYELDMYERPISPGEREEFPNVSRNSTRKPEIPHPSARNSPSPMRMKRREEKKRIVPVTSMSQGQDLKSKESRKSVFVRSRNPMAKLFDGAEDAATAGDDYFSYKHRVRSGTAKRTSPIVRQCERASSSYETPLSPIPVRLMSSTSPLLLKRRDAICLPYGYALSPSTPTTDFREYIPTSAVSTDETSKDVMSTRSIPSLPLSLPVSLQSLISKSRPTSALTTPTSSPHLGYKDGELGKELEKVDESTMDDSAMVADQLRRLIEDASEVKVAFRNPFQKRDGEEAATEREIIIDVAPDVIV